MNPHPDEPHLLDTSAVIIMTHSRQVAAPDAFVGFVTLGELAAGIVRARDPRRGEEEVSTALGSAEVLFATLRTVRLYGEIIVSLRRIGQPIPTNDVWIAALALEHDLPLLADDAHFARVPGLRHIPIRCPTPWPITLRGAFPRIVPSCQPRLCPEATAAPCGPGPPAATSI